MLPLWEQAMCSSGCDIRKKMKEIESRTFGDTNVLSIDTQTFILMVLSGLQAWLAQV